MMREKQWIGFLEVVGIILDEFGRVHGRPQQVPREDPTKKAGKGHNVEFTVHIFSDKKMWKVDEARNKQIDLFLALQVQDVSPNAQEQITMRVHDALGGNIRQNEDASVLVIEGFGDRN
ncbi:EIF2B2 [Lepeophtheirus salmonis]|uniref:EIF2B2 n=1 Tax=Lepeophtheirus salmonis TaxID=72036 RepID=A0A7R8H1Z1_LEPSM|nr:EIF2B2 [Lepeophtheirus salmonis]CAF2803912.1 EIF2B2 [Lepeophtheirus salmonis]